MCFYCNWACLACESRASYFLNTESNGTRRRNNPRLDNNN